MLLMGYFSTSIHSLIFSAFLLGAPIHMSAGAQSQKDPLPEGDGKSLVLATCIQCHSLASVVGQRKSPKAWEDTVKDMVSRGAQVRPEEVASVASYLASSFGPDSGTAANGDTRPGDLVTKASPPDVLPEGAGKALLMRSCADRHGLKKVTEQRKTEAGWAASIRDMLKLGAAVKREEIPVLVSYLTTNFGHAASGVRSAGEPLGPTPSSNLSTMLPDGDGKGMILANCVQCHGLQEIVGQRKDAERWKLTVYDMVARGAQLTWSEVELVSSYLGTHLTK